MTDSRSLSRRGFLQLTLAGAGLALLGCADHRAGAQALPATQAAPEVTSTPAAIAALPSKSVFPAGREQRAMLSGTEWENPLFIAHSGQPGKTVLVLGGVHGNEPGGWLAADEVATWEPHTGSILVIPHANAVADRVLERTLPELGDLNRLYPGDRDGMPMARMAAAILDVAQTFQADYLLDMHESWIFYAERPVNGTAYLGQTIASSSGREANTLPRELAHLANARVDRERDKMWTRDQLPLPGPSQTPAPSIPNAGGSGTSSLSVGRFVEGITPLLVEMGQQDQAIERRVALHLLVARSLLESRGML